MKNRGMEKKGCTTTGIQMTRAIVPYLQVKLDREDTGTAAMQSGVVIDFLCEGRGGEGECQTQGSFFETH